MPTAAFVAGPEALFRAQPGPLLKNRVFRLEPLFFPSSSLGGPWEAPGRPLGGPGRLSRSPREPVPGPPQNRLSRGPPGTGCPGASGRPGALLGQMSRGPPGTPPGQLSRGPPGTPRDAPRTLSRGPPGTPKFEILGAISVLKNHILNRDPGRSWGPPHLGCFWRQTFPESLKLKNATPDPGVPLIWGANFPSQGGVGV